MIGVDVQELIDSKEKPVLNFAENCNPTNLTQGYILLTETQCAHELEKSRLIIQQKDKEISWLQKENQRLEEIIELLKQSLKMAKGSGL